jgi:hypothetical protein
MKLLMIRYFQIRRDLGFWIFLIAAFIFFTAQAIASEKSSYAWYLAILASFGLYQHYLQRRDLVFIKTYFDHSRWHIVLNYNLTLLPCSAALLLTNNFLPVIFMHGFVSAIPMMNFSLNGPAYLFLGRYIPSTQFEWISGLRKNGLILIALLLLAMALSPVKLFGPGALFLLNLIFIGFYNLFEPRIMLNAHHLPVDRFLREKARYLCMMVVFINLPLLAVNCIFHPEVTFINLAFLFSFILLAANSVLIKYANYLPGESMSFSGDMLVLFAAVFIPYLLPLSVLLYFVNLKKAKNNLLQFIDE